MRIRLTSFSCQCFSDGKCCESILQVNAVSQFLPESLRDTQW